MKNDIKNVIIDCDPGSDDAINLFLALASPEKINILGIVTVAGNVSLDKTQRNARILCEIANRNDIPVFAGNAKPLKVELTTAEEVFGAEGMNGIEIYEPSLPLQKKHGVDFIIDTLLAADDDSITLVPTGPLTNIAMAISRNPEIKPKIKEIILMGGALREGGNITPSAEFNIYVDPHAADIVFSSGLPLVVFGLDVTHQVLSSKDVLNKIKSIGNPVSDLAYNLLTHYGRFDSNKYGYDGGPIHDACTIAYILEPGLFELKNCNIRVETESLICRGHTAVDFWHCWFCDDLPKNSRWAYSVNRNGFFELLLKQLAKFSDQ